MRCFAEVRILSLLHWPLVKEWNLLMNDVVLWPWVWGKWCVLDCQHCLLLIKVSLSDIPEGSTTEGWLYSKNMPTYPAGEMEPWWDSIFGSLVWDVLCTSRGFPIEREKACPGMTLWRWQLAHTPHSPNSLLQGHLWLWCISTHYCCCYVGSSLYNKLNICKPGWFALWESSLVIKSCLIATANVVPVSPLSGKVPGL